MRCNPRTRTQRAREPVSSWQPAQRQLLRMLQVPLARHEIHFETDALGIFEEQRVITRRPRAFLGWVHDPDAALSQERIQLVDVLPRPGAEADVMQTDAPLIEQCSTI